MSCLRGACGLSCELLASRLICLNYLAELFADILRPAGHCKNAMWILRKKNRPGERSVLTTHMVSIGKRIKGCFIDERFIRII